MNEEQKRDAARDFIRSAILPLIEDVLVKKFCQSMDVIAEQNRDLSDEKETLLVALEGAANFLRGMSFDPSLTGEIPSACMAKATEIDAVVERHHDA